jgi:hypothetical protein
VNILYTTTDKIRAVIGLDDDDMPDAFINGRDLDLLMAERLDVVFPLHEDNSDDAIDRKLRLWCMYFGALTLIEDGVLALLKKQQANTDSQERFDIDFEALKASLRGKINTLETKLSPEMVPASISIMGKASPGRDPITGI